MDASRKIANTLPSATEMLTWLGTLRSTVEDFAAREETLKVAFRARCDVEINSHAARLRELDDRRTGQSAAAELKLAEALQRNEARFLRRKDAVVRAHQSARKKIGADLDTRESRLNQSVRERAAIAENQRDQQLAANEAAYSDFKAKLTDAETVQAELTEATRNAFRGYGAFRRLLEPGRTWPEPDFSPDASQLFAEFQKLDSKTRAELGGFKKLMVPQLFRFVPIQLASLVLAAVTAAALLLPRFKIQTIPLAAGWACLGALAMVWILYWLGLRAATPAATKLAADLAKLRRLLDGCFDKAGRGHDAEKRRLQEEFDTCIRAVNLEWKEQTKLLTNLRRSLPDTVDEKARRLTQTTEDLRRKSEDDAKRHQAETIARCRQEVLEQTELATAAHAPKMRGLEDEYRHNWVVLEKNWKETIEPLYAQLRAAADTAAELFPDWSLPVWEQWTPPKDFKQAATFGRLEVALELLAARLPADPRLALPGPARFTTPISLTYPLEGSILFETGQSGASEAVASVNNILFRLLSTLPPGKSSFTIFDPVGLGQNFAALMHLADYEDSSINSRIWTQSAQFEEKLAELNEHMEKVIQMYLRNEYATIAEYNAEAGTIAERYHFLVIASFPANFSDTAANRLRNIAASGARCGVYTLIQWDQRAALPQGLVLEDLRKNSLCLVHTGKGFEFSGRKLTGTRLLLDPPPEPEFATRFLHQAGESSKDSSRVQVPFAQVAPPDSELWSGNTTEELRVPIGRSGATKLQYLEIGKGTRQHTLIAGKTGSGKSTLFHVIVTNLALWCSPEQVEFYLVDFKKGVEFKCYASRRLPHARVVAIESDRAFGLSVLQRVDDELRRRGDLFRRVGAQDLAGYKRSGGTETMPRSLLLIDEFQEFFVEEDRVSQGAAVLLDRIVRQGRAFGIHVLLGSQTLGGAYSLARATLGQMVIRIALQCNEADAYLIMDQDNPAPRLLSRPGEGIYNDTAGSIEGNSPFQTVWLGDQERDQHLEKIRVRADQNADAYPGPIVFEGNAPADVRDNLLLRALCQQTPSTPPSQARIWLGSPNSIKGPTEAVFQRQSGSNLLIVGQSEERASTLLSVALVALAAQYPRGQVRFVVLDSTPPGFPQREFLQKVIAALPHEVVQLDAGLPAIMAGLDEELKRRGGEAPGPAPDTFILIQGLQNFKKLKQEDDYSFSSGDAQPAAPAAVLMDLITEGPGRGMHVLAALDTYNNVNRFLGRKTLSEFEMRVLFQMSASDSASLIDAPDASTLGLHRGIYYHDREGLLETFRPYAQPDLHWLENATHSPPTPAGASAASEP